MLWSTGDESHTAPPPPTTNSPGGKENGIKRGNVEWTTVGGTNRLRWLHSGCLLNANHKTAHSFPVFQQREEVTKSIGKDLLMPSSPSTPPLPQTQHQQVMPLLPADCTLSPPSSSIPMATTRRWAAVISCQDHPDDLFIPVLSPYNQSSTQQPEQGF